MSKYAVAFIDDQTDERDRALRYLGGRFTVGVGGSVEESLRDLRSKGRRCPDVWLVDLYFPEGPTDVTDPVAALNVARSEFLRAEARFYEVLASVRQTPRGGFREARRASSMCPAPVIFFSRKGTLDDAIAAYEDEKPAAVLKKPDPPPGLAASATPEGLQTLYDAAFEEAVPRISSKIERVIHISKWRVKHRRDHHGSAELPHRTSVVWPGHMGGIFPRALACRLTN